MDIKSVFRQVLPFQLRTSETKKAVSTEQSSDRDANGQQQKENGEPPKRELTREEIDDAVLYLKALEGIKENGLLVRVENKDGIVVVFVEDAQGKVIRRIPAIELSLLTKDRQKKSGHILNKAI
jgi:uncharacterized FlaG/YvyC family protein